MRTVAHHLYAHPEGVSPRMVPRAHPDFKAERNLAWFNDVASRGADADYVEATGEVGDVYLLHPLMLHSATNNKLRNVRIITNPPVSLRAPFDFDREDPREYSLVERATMRMLGKEGEGLKGWKITQPREAVVPARVRIQEQMKRDELKRLEEEKKREAAAVAAA